MSATAWACDPCALYSAARMQGHSEGAFSLAVSEQYTDYDKTSNSTQGTIKDGELTKSFSTTQIAAAYDLSKCWGLQLTLPVITRDKTEIKNYRSSSETETGIVDIVLMTGYSLVNSYSADWTKILGVSFGVKFPTGDTGDLDEPNETVEIEPDNLSLRHHTLVSSSGEGALTNGSGSYDYIFGLSWLTRYQKFLFLSNAQYDLRTEGDFGYEFADDFLWSVGPGYYLSLSDTHSLALRLALAGEEKAKDKRDGVLQAGSEVHNLYLGPEVLFTINSQVSGEVGFDFRVNDQDEDATVVADYRLRAALAYRFQ